MKPSSCLFQTPDLRPSIKRRLCFPAGLFPLTAECVCEFVCVPRVRPRLRLPVSLTGMRLLVRGGGIEGDNVSGLSRQLWLRRRLTDRAVSFDLFLTRALTRFPPSARFVSGQTVSTCYCCPPAWLRICRSVCQPASGLRREASFIKRKQAGDEDMRTVNLLEMFQRLRGSSH